MTIPDGYQELQRVPLEKEDRLLLESLQKASESIREAVCRELERLGLKYVGAHAAGDDCTVIFDNGQAVILEPTRLVATMGAYRINPSKLK